MCILNTEHSCRSCNGALSVHGILGIGTSALRSRMISIVEHQATVESGLKMRIKRKNLCPSLTSVAKVVSGGGLLFEALENGYTIDEEGSASDGNLAITKRGKKCRKIAGGNLRSRGSSKSRKKVRHFGHRVEGVSSVTCCGLLKELSDTQECSNMDELTETENDRAFESSEGTSLNEKQGLKEIEDSEGTLSKERDGYRKETSLAEPPSEDVSTNWCQRRDVGTEMSDVAVITDPDCLGPCAPGTSVILEGIVWNESNNGILVVNVTWRGKTYVGTLMDTTKHDWAPPRFREDSPHDEPSTSSKRGGCSSVGTAEVIEGRRLRKCRRDAAAAAAAAAAASSATKPWCARLNTDPTETIPPRQQLFPLRNEDRSERSSCSSSIPKRTSRVTDGSETLLQCSEPNCEKKYRRMSGLRYHQSHAHRRPSSAADGGINAFSCVAGKKRELGINPFVDLSKSLSPAVDAGRDCEELESASGKADLDVSDARIEKTTPLSRKSKAIEGGLCKKLRTRVEDVGDNQHSFFKKSESDVAETSINSVELNCHKTFECNENYSNVVTDDVTAGPYKNSGEQLSFLDKKMSCLSFKGYRGCPKNNNDCPLESNSKDIRLHETLPMLLKHFYNGTLAPEQSTLSLNDVSFDPARKKLLVIDPQQICGTEISTRFSAELKSHLKNIHPLSDQSVNEILTPNVEIESNPLIVCSVPVKSCKGKLSDCTCCNTLKPKTLTQVFDSNSLQNASDSEDHLPHHESTGDFKHMRVTKELCAVSTFDFKVFEKSSELSSKYSLAEEISGVSEDVFQHPSCGSAGGDQRGEMLAGKHSTVRNPLCGDDEQCSLILPRNGIRKMQGLDEDANNQAFVTAIGGAPSPPGPSCRATTTTISQLSSGPSQLLPDLTKAFDAFRGPLGDSSLNSDDPFREPRTSQGEAEDGEYLRCVESDVTPIVDIHIQTLDRKTCSSLQRSSEDMIQVRGDDSFPSSDKEASTRNQPNVRTNDSAKHSNSGKTVGPDASQSNSVAMLISQMASEIAAYGENLPLDEHFDNSKSHVLCILHRTKPSTTDGKNHQSNAEQSKHGWTDETLSRLLVPHSSTRSTVSHSSTKSTVPHSRTKIIVPQSSIKSIDAQDTKPKADKSDPKLSQKTTTEQDIGTSNENPGRESNQLCSSSAVHVRSTNSATIRQKMETKSISECPTRAGKGVQSDLDLSQANGVISQNPIRRSQSRNCQSPSVDRHLHSHAVTKSPFSSVYGQFSSQHPEGQSLRQRGKDKSIPFCRLPLSFLLSLFRI